ncbi:MAG: hypothetical protein WCI27_01180 [Candidatus Omnitrophota bacterium]
MFINKNGLVVGKRDIVISWVQLAAYFIFFVVLAQGLIHRLIQNSCVNFWQDESLIVFVANHAPFTMDFFRALKSMTAGMPWPFMEYWAYLSVLKAIVPLDYLMAHLEFFLRLPLFFYSLLMALAVFVMVRTLARSAVVALWITSYVFVDSVLAAHLGSEMRFHASGMAHAALSWCLLALMLTRPEGKESRVKRVLFFMWFASGVIASSAHLYAAYSFYMQLIVAAGVEFGCFPDLKLPHMSRKIKLLILGAGMIAGGLCARFIGLLHSPAGGRVEDFGGAIKAICQVFNILLPPAGLLWAVGFVVLGAIFWRKTNIHAGKKVFILCLGVLQAGVIAVLAYKYFAWRGFGLMAWVPRYASAGLLPLVFFCCYLLRFSISHHIDRKWGVWGLCFFLFSLVAGHVHASSYWGDDRIDLKDQRWSMAKDNILRLKVLGKVTYIIGAVPNADHSLMADVHGLSLDHTWQIYTGGPFAVAPISRYKVNLYGGRTGLPCEERERYPVAEDGRAKSYAVDFCEHGKVVLRVVEKN